MWVGPLADSAEAAEAALAAATEAVANSKQAAGLVVAALEEVKPLPGTFF